jgi:S1-C subfamily serine protease
VKRIRLTLTSLAALACAAGAADCAPAAAAADPPPAASTADQQAGHADSEADLEAQLEAARKQLEIAARQVAELSAQLGRPLIQRFMQFADEPGRAIIGVQLDEGAGGGRGAQVREVSPGGPAAEAGVRAGDVITAINGTEITGADAVGQVVALMRDVKPDTKVTVRVLRDGKPREFAIVTRPGPVYFLAHRFAGPDMEGFARLAPPELVRGPLGDMELVTLTPQLGRYFGSDKGVLVVRAPAGLKLEDGDVILSVDGRQPLSGSHATRILASYQPGEKLTLRVIRMRKTIEVETTVPERAGALQVPAPPLPPLPPTPPPRDGPVSNSATDMASGHSLAGV